MGGELNLALRIAQRSFKLIFVLHNLVNEGLNDG